MHNSEEDDNNYQLQQDFATVYQTGVEYGDYWWLTEQEFIAQEMAKVNQRRNQYRRERTQAARTEQHNARIMSLFNARNEYLENQAREVRERREARMLAELEEYGQQQNEIWFRRERRRRAALLKQQLCRQANLAYNSPLMQNKK